MQSTGQARAHLSHPMQVVRSNRWNPRYRGRTGTGRSGYSKWDVNVLRRKVWNSVQSVTCMPAAMVTIASQTFRNHTRIGRPIESGVIKELYRPDGRPAVTHQRPATAYSSSDHVAGPRVCRSAGRVFRSSPRRAVLRIRSTSSSARAACRPSMTRWSNVSPTSTRPSGEIGPKSKYAVSGIRGTVAITRKVQRRDPINVPNRLHRLNPDQQRLDQNTNRRSGAG